jgi:feruloyl esterase
MKLFLAILTALVPSIASAQAGSDAACDRVAATLKLPDANITSAHLVPAGSFTPPAAGTDTPRPVANLPAFCRVELTIKPSSDSDIKTEVWMPLSGWNGKFQQVGNGAFAGSIQYGALGDALRRGYAAASTDTGHTGTGAQWAAGHPEKIIDWGYRSEHLTAVEGKAAITNFYGIGPKLSYFTGCSGGGRMAFQEAQRFPADFDAILAGAPAYDRGNEAFGFMMKWKATHETPESVIPTSKYPAIHRAALDACDALDGLKDGIIEDVLNCHFDPKVIECKAGTNNDSCLTPPQVEGARKIYAGAKNPRTGALIFPGLEPGSELQWTAVTGGDVPLDVGYDVFKYILFQDPKWDPKTFDLAKDYDRIHKLDNLDLSPTSADLKAFTSRGGKLLIYQGWADPNVSPRSPLMYYDRLVKTIASLVAQGDCVLVGRGVAHILPVETTLRVRLVAPVAWRVAAMSRKLGVSEEEAAVKVAAIERHRVQFVREHFNKDTTDSSLYDLVLNTERFSVEQCADLIVEALHRLQAAVPGKAADSGALPGAAH